MERIPLYLKTSHNTAARNEYEKGLGNFAYFTVFQILYSKFGIWRGTRDSPWSHKLPLKYKRD